MLATIIEVKPRAAAISAYSPNRPMCAARRSVPQAIELTVAHAGRAVLFSGLTVFIGLLGLVSFDFMMLRSLGVGGAIVVLVGVLAALTLLPALLGFVGHRIDAFTIVRWGEGRGQWWTRLADGVMRRPWA